MKTAFLNGVINETIYMKQAPGFVQNGKENHVCLLQRSLYGLKQAAKSWNDAINEILITYNFIRCSSDNCLYYKKYENGNWCLLLIYVDDILIIATNDYIYTEVKKNISSEFKIHELGEAKYFLKIQITQSNDGIYSINQGKYTNKIVKEFNFENAKTSTTPLDAGYEKEQFNNQIALTSNAQYQKLIGSLLYVALSSRPDISASISILANSI